MSATPEPPRRGIVFLCVANSARSQLAEAIAQRLAPPGVRVESAGSHPFRVHPAAIRVLAEKGMDLSGAHSKGMDEVRFDEADLVVTLCAEEVCPRVPPGVRRLHWPLADPAEAIGEEEQLRRFRETRDQLETRIRALFRSGTGSPASGSGGTPRPRIRPRSERP